MSAFGPDDLNKLFPSINNVSFEMVPFSKAVLQNRNHGRSSPGMEMEIIQSKHTNSDKELQVSVIYICTVYSVYVVAR